MGWDGMGCEAKRREGRRAMGREAGHDAVRPPTAPIDGQSLPCVGLGRERFPVGTYMDVRTKDACDECQPEERAGWMHARAHRKHHSTAQPARSANFHSRRQVGIAAGARARQPDRTHPPAAPGPCQAPSPGSARKAAWGAWPPGPNPGLPFPNRKRKGNVRDVVGPSISSVSSLNMRDLLIEFMIPKTGHPTASLSQPKPEPPVSPPLPHVPKGARSAGKLVQSLRYCT